jgi:hypothetical protein
LDRRRVTDKHWHSTELLKSFCDGLLFPLPTGGGGGTLAGMSDANINDGGPAFPCNVQIEDNNGSHYEEHYGLKMRDWFIDGTDAFREQVCRNWVSAFAANARWAGARR